MLIRVFKNGKSQELFGYEGYISGIQETQPSVFEETIFDFYDITDADILNDIRLHKNKYRYGEGTAAELTPDKWNDFALSESELEAKNNYNPIL